MASNTNKGIIQKGIIQTQGIDRYVLTDQCRDKIREEYPNNIRIYNKE